MIVGVSVHILTRCRLLPPQAVIVGVSVQKLTRENTVKHTMAEVQQIRQLAGRDDILPLLANSLAPSIYGHDIIKRGLVLQLSQLHNSVPKRNKREARMPSSAM